MSNKNEESDRKSWESSKSESSEDSREEEEPMVNYH